MHRSLVIFPVKVDGANTPVHSGFRLEKVDGTNAQVHAAVAYLHHLHQISPETIHAAMHGAYPKYL